MKSRVTFAGFAVFAVTILTSMDRPEGAGQVVARRFETNPLVTLRSSASLGDNINGPAIIRVPEWVERPLGRYYMYFAHHSGHHIRLAYADAIEGPWRIHEPGVLPVGKTAFARELPDPPRGPGSFYTHVASPEVYVDHANRRFIMWTHGMWTNGERWPNDVAAAQSWASEKRYGQLTQVSESRDGLAFEARPALTRVSYLRVFRQGDWFYGMARSGRLARSRDPLATFEAGGNPFAGGPYDDRVRHVALLVRGQTLYVFFTAIGDAPERVLVSTIDLTREWNEWRATPPVEVLRPERAYECPDLPLVPSRAGELAKPANEMRDPAIFEEGGRTYLFYSLCGEQGIAAAELTFSDAQ
jgi:hypothetical protein